MEVIKIYKNGDKVNSSSPGNVSELFIALYCVWEELQITIKITLTGMKITWFIFAEEKVKQINSICEA